MTSTHPTPPARIPAAAAVLDVVNDATHALLPGVCGNDHISMQAAMRQLHDQLIARTGAARRSGVYWRRVFGHAEGHRTLDALYSPNSRQTPTAAGLQQLRTYLDMFPDQSVLIIASCEVDPSIAPPTGRPAAIESPAAGNDPAIDGALR